MKDAFPRTIAPPISGDMADAVSTPWTPPPAILDPARSVAAPGPIPLGASCGTCHFGEAVQNDLSQVACFGVPPTPVIAGVDQRGHAQVTVIRPHLARSHRCCALWRPRPAS